MVAASISPKMLRFVVITLYIMVVHCAADTGSRNKCQPNPCQHEGVCRLRRWPDRGFHCRCRGHHWGRLCEKESRCQHGNPCQNNGSCMTASNSLTKLGYNCMCVEGYYRIHCEKVSVCIRANPCQNGARCVPYDNRGRAGYHCICKPDSYGKTCSKGNPCLSGDVCNGGHCTMDIYSIDARYSCDCAVGRAGDNCQYVDPCMPANPCQNSGRCESYLTSSGYIKYCRCPKTHWGYNCEKESPCNAKPCQNDGKCYRRDYTFFCDCPRGFSGQRCEKKICPLKVYMCHFGLVKRIRPNGGKGKGRPDPAQCVTGVKQRYHRINACRANMTAQIINSRNCNCLTKDIWHMSFSTDFDIEYGSIQRCYLSHESMKSLSCLSRIRPCVDIVWKAIRYFRFSNCSTENLATKRDLKQCVHDFEAGHVMAIGNCSPVQKLISLVVTLFRLVEKMMCASCNPWNFTECLRPIHGDYYRMTYCTMIKEHAAIKQCLVKKVDSNLSCSPFKDDILTAVDFYIEALKKYEQKTCERQDNYAKMREEIWGCPTEE